MSSSSIVVTRYFLYARREASPLRKWYPLGLVTLTTGKLVFATVNFAHPMSIHSNIVR